MRSSRQTLFEKAYLEGDLATQAQCYLDEANAIIKQDIEGACFNYTHAYVLALDAGAKSIADAALKALKTYGRE